jgi:predicted DCC family thiol-disulfide oxidoreductase YuxK
MTTTWTGGQYSLLRVCLACGLAGLVVDSDAPLAMRFAAIVFGAALALGVRDRLAALALAIVAALPSLWASAALAVHAALPAAPYGSWDARRRPDPGGDWTMPDWAPTLGWTVAVALHLWWGAWRVVAGEWVIGVIEVGLVGLLTRAEHRRWAWLALALLATADNAPLGVLFFHAFAFDPAWVPASARIVPATVFYDGTCGLCHRVVRFILAEDRPGVFELAPLASPAFVRLVPKDERPALPDSIVLRTRDGELLVRSRAAIEILMALGGLWRIAGTLASVVPHEVADRLYDAVAGNRARWFGPPDASCPLVPPALRGRFTADAFPAADQPGPSAAR